MKYLFTLYLIIICSCQNSGHIMVNKGITKRLTIDKQEQFCTDIEYFKSSVPVLLETNEKSLIKKIDKIMVDDNLLFIFDRPMNRVVIFNKTGEYISEISCVGIGPGEYKQLTDVCLNTEDKQIILCPDYPNKLMYFDYSGKFLFEKPIKELYREIVSDGDNIYLTRLLPYRKNDNPCFLSIVDNKSFTENCLFTEPNIPDSPFFDSGYLLTKGKRVTFSTRYNNFIYRITDNEIEKAYIIDFGNENLPEKYQNNNVTQDELRDVSVKSPYVYSISEINENSNYLSFKTNKIGFYIYSKQDTTLKHFQSLFLSQYGIYSGRMQHIENEENTLAFLINPGYFVRLKKMIEENKTSAITQKTLDLIDRVKSDDNPVIFLCEFK